MKKTGQRRAQKAKGPRQAPKSQSLVELSINFRANLFRKRELPEKLTTERGRIEEGIWAMQELKVGDADFVMVFGRTWEGVVENTFEGVLDTPAERALEAVAAKKTEG